MAGLLGKLNVKIDADTAAFNAALDKGASKAQATMAGIQRSVKRAAPIIGAALTAAAAGFSVALKKTVDDADELSKLSRKIGIGIEALSAYRLAAQLAGTDFETLTKGIGRFGRNISDASNGLSTPLRAFEYLGIAFENADGSLRNVDDTLLDVADAFSRMEDGTRKAALAAELFGRGGFELIPFLNEGREGIAKIREEAEKLGIVFDRDSARAAERFNDNLVRMKSVAQGIFISISNELLPVMVDLSDELVDGAGNTKNMKKNTDLLASSLITVVGIGKHVAASFVEIGNAMGDTLAIIRVLGGNGTTSGAFSGPLINAIRFQKELKAIMDKRNSDRGQALKDATAEIEALWEKHFRRQQEIAMEGAGNVSKSQKEGFEGTSKDFTDMLKEGAALARAVRTPLEVFADEQERLNELLERGAISQDTFNRAMEKAKGVYEKNTTSLQSQGSILKDLNTTFASSFENAIVNGEKFSDVLKGLEQDILRIVIRKQFLDPVLGAIFGGFGAAAGGGGGFLSTLLSAKGNAFYGGSVMAFKNGGILGGPMAFPMAGGRTGVAGEAGPEAVLPLMRGSDGSLGVKTGGGGRVEVNVYAPPNSEVRTESERDGGIERLNIFLDEANAQNIRPGTKTFKALQRTFGLNQQTVAR